MLRLESRIEGIGEHFNKGIENVIKNQSEIKNTIPEMKTTLKIINNRLVNTEE